MKGDKKILVVAILVLLLSVCFSTYAIYRSTASGSGTVKAAAWSVKVNGSDVSTANFTFDYDDIEWTTLTGYNDTIAPGSSGKIVIPVDATGSEVDVLVTAALGTITGLPDGVTVSLANGGTTTIGYAASDMTADIEINVAWSGADSDSTSKDGTDLAAKGSTISIPVTLTAKQSVAGHTQP